MKPFVVSRCGRIVFPFNIKRDFEGKAPLTAVIKAGYRALLPTWDEGTEDKISRILLDVFRHKKGAGAVGGYVVMRFDPAVVA